MRSGPGRLTWGVVPIAVGEFYLCLLVLERKFGTQRDNQVLRGQAQ